jgi:hypothetical protein
LLPAVNVEELELVWVCCGWRTPRWVIYHPKHVEQFPNKINCVMLHPFWIQIRILLRCTDPWTLKSGEEHTCYFLHSHFTSSLLCPNIFPSNFYTLSLCHSINVTDQDL